MNESLPNQRKFIGNVINSLWDTVYIFDPETGMGVRWNRALEEISGYDYQKMKCYPSTHFYPEEEHKLIDRCMKDVQEFGRGKVELNYIISDGSRVPFEYCVVPITGPDGENWMCAIGRDITERKQAERERDQYINELHQALEKVQTLSGLFPICSHCKKIRDDKGYWNQIEEYIEEHSAAEFSHSICNECAEKLYPSELNPYND